MLNKFFFNEPKPEDENMESKSWLYEFTKPDSEDETNNEGVSSCL